MSLTWPLALTALLAFPLLLGFRAWLRRRRRRDALRVSSVTLGPRPELVMVIDCGSAAAIAGGSSPVLPSTAVSTCMAR